MTKRILILGGDGMLGHQLIQKLSGNFHVLSTLRGQADDTKRHDLFAIDRTFFGCDLRDEKVLKDAIVNAQPDVVINAAGIVKQRAASEEILQSLEVNSLLPHRLAGLCHANHARLLHISTDCVFAGTRGGYKESDTADATDNYGRTKLLGEVSAEGCLTLRTSIIGLEIKRFKSLIEWFLRQQGVVRGYTNAIFSGVTTAELCRVIHTLITDQPAMHGLYHLASEPISKHDLIHQFAQHLGQSIPIEPEHSVKIDRSLDGGLFKAKTGYEPPEWGEMLAELANEAGSRSPIV